MPQHINIQTVPTHRIAIHSYLWLSFFLAILIPVSIYTSFTYAFKVAFAVVFPLIPPVYINFFLLEKYFSRKLYLTYTLWFIVLAVCSGALAQVMVTITVPLEEGDNFVTAVDPLFLIILTGGARYYLRGTKLQLQLHEAQAKQLKAELDLLKHQVNPHFFFNTLNNLFAMARRQKDQATARGIAKLSHIMRYIIYDGVVEKIEITKEIEQIKNFIELQRLRFSTDDDIKITFDMEGNLNHKMITPMLLIPFVENAFKHGISLKMSSPIRISLRLHEDRLFFSVKNNINRMRQNRDDQNSGIGLANVKRRLQLLYPKTHKLEIVDDGEKFAISLILQL
jgi:two-component system LytT family sensor kinase